MEFNWASSKKTQGARYLSRAIFFALKKKKTIEAMFSISISLPSLANKNYDLAEKEGNCYSRHFESNSGSISIAGKLRDAHKSTTLILSII